MTVRFSVDDRDAQRSFDRLLDVGRAVEACEAVLARQHQAMQRATHVITGSLRGSEDIDSDFRTGRWAGQLVAGGPSPGFVNNPVVYAVYELARGGLHDFRAPAEAMSGQYGDAMRAHLERAAR